MKNLCTKMLEAFTQIYLQYFHMSSGILGDLKALPTFIYFRYLNIIYSFNKYL